MFVTVRVHVREALSSVRLTGVFSARLRRFEQKYFSRKSVVVLCDRLIIIATRICTIRSMMHACVVTWCTHFYVGEVSRVLGDA